MRLGPGKNQGRLYMLHEAPLYRSWKSTEMEGHGEEALNGMIVWASKVSGVHQWKE